MVDDTTESSCVGTLKCYQFFLTGILCDVYLGALTPNIFDEQDSIVKLAHEPVEQFLVLEILTFFLSRLG